MGWILFLGCMFIIFLTRPKPKGVGKDLRIFDVLPFSNLRECGHP